MKINSFIQSSIIFFLLISTSFSQNIYLYGNVGYNLPLSGKFNFSYTNNSVEFLKSDYGKEISIKVGSSYFISKNIGVDFYVSYLFTPEKTFNGYIWEESEYFENTNLSLNPSIILQSKIGQLIPYAKFGFSINFINVNIFLNDIEYPSYEYSTDYTFGFNAGLGLKLSLNNQFLIFIEASLSSLTLFADKVIYNWEENGVKYSEEYDLKTEFGIGYGNLEAARDFPFNSFGISLGIMYNL